MFQILNSPFPISLFFHPPRLHKIKTPPFGDFLGRLVASIASFSFLLAFHFSIDLKSEKEPWQTTFFEGVFTLSSAEKLTSIVMKASIRHSSSCSLKILPSSLNNRLRRSSKNS